MRFVSTSAFSTMTAFTSPCTQTQSTGSCSRFTLQHAMVLILMSQCKHVLIKPSADITALLGYKRINDELFTTAL